MDHFQIGLATETKADNSPVTVADTAVNSMVIEEVHKHFPAHSVRGEEESTQQKDDEFVWVCDPIDGTIPYAHGIPTNVFSLALVQSGEPIAAVIYDPYMKRLFSAEKNKGATLNKSPAHVKNASSIKHETIGLSGPPRLYAVTDDAVLLSAVRTAGARPIELGSAIYEAAMVAAGEFVGQIFAGRTAHDIAAVKLIVEEAGGKVTDLLGRDQRYDRPIYGAVVSNGRIHDDLLELIKPYLAEES